MSRRRKLILIGAVLVGVLSAFVVFSYTNPAGTHKPYSGSCDTAALNHIQGQDNRMEAKLDCLLGR